MIMADDNLLKLQFTIQVEFQITDKQKEYAKTQDRYDYEQEYAEMFRGFFDFHDGVNVKDYYCEADMPDEFFADGD